MLPKVRVFSCRIGQNILPTYDNIACIRKNLSTTCPRCKNSDETLIHAMKECPKNYWNDRNKMVFHGKADATMVVWEIAQTFSNEFKIFNLANPPVLPQNPVRKGWTKPPNGFVKINVDAVILNGNVGFGAIARDHDGFVLGGCYGHANKNLDAI
ncbi:hypothetical protein CXB51_008562 [Gossypium anomalum]|uniref:Reverse transcriptase zinc-binding domain-containing protein n=1 Tax=Gossypium anomalum TaxID=47600 RepID=A0A8J5ZFB8_9ROSI|nr:hypothetical protein CXB51_008562 [Gossypium anomalum]